MYRDERAAPFGVKVMAWQRGTPPHDVGGDEPLTMLPSKAMALDPALESEVRSLIDDYRERCLRQLSGARGSR